MTHVDALGIRARLGRDDWQAPRPMAELLGVELLEPAPAVFPDEAWVFAGRGSRRGWSVIVSIGVFDRPGFVGEWWIHASIASPGSSAEVPEYADLVLLHRAVWQAGHAVQVFVPPAEHVNIHPTALHLWGRADGARVLPDFGAQGSI